MRLYFPIKHELSTCYFEKHSFWPFFILFCVMPSAILPDPSLAFNEIDSRNFFLKGLQPNITNGMTHCNLAKDTTVTHADVYSDQDKS